MTGATTIPVELGDRSYPVHVGPGLLAERDAMTAGLEGGRVLVVTDANVGPLYLESALATLRDFAPATLELPAGEPGKTLDTAARVFDALVETGCRRDATVVALGGGVIGDLAGFAAACYMRGIGFVQVPTTLLAQVDASVGGKTGVNHPAGKNLVGAFHQPRAVVADTATLATLPEREYLAGLAEVVKYGLIRDAAFFDWLEEHADDLVARQTAVLTEAIARSVRHKAEVVAADERESGQRALLNLGHTFAHALESETGYGRWLHGEAVAIGLVQAARLSALAGHCPGDVAARTQALLSRLGLETSAPADLAPRDLLERMRLDKKANRSGLRFVLPRGVGDAFVSSEISEDQVLAVLGGGYE